MASTLKERFQHAFNRFLQQKMGACRVVWTPLKLMVVATIIGLLSISLGIACLHASRKVVEIVRRYDAECISSIIANRAEFIQNPETNKTCVITLTVPKKMQKPIFVYYQLVNFYQNHKIYFNSRSDKQLRSNDSIDDTKTCSPVDTVQGQKESIVPCGLIAWTLFNDTYRFSVGFKTLLVNQTNIAWKSDKEYRFGQNVFPNHFQEGLQGGARLSNKVPLSRQEALMVWMRPAPFSTFRKLYGRIEEDLEANDNITVVIGNHYNTYYPGGQKKSSIVYHDLDWWEE